LDKGRMCIPHSIKYNVEYSIFTLAQESIERDNGYINNWLKKCSLVPPCPMVELEHESRGRGSRVG